MAEAKSNPNGWVYAIDARYDQNGGVPPEAVQGAWCVNEDGEIVGDFIPNPNYVTNHPKREAGNSGKVVPNITSRRTPPNSGVR